MSLRRRVFAKVYDRLTVGYEQLLGDRRARLLGGVTGRVLELGPGTGANFAAYSRPEEMEWHGLEPNPHMRARLAPKAESVGVRPRFVEYQGARIEAEDDRFDHVVSTLVLCSVPDVAATLVEIQRVLRPGGTLRFLEHVAEPRGTWRRRGQRLLAPCWRLCADGCHLDRELASDLERAAFQSLEIESFRAHLPHVWGYAVSR